MFGNGARGRNGGAHLQVGDLHHRYERRAA